MDRFNVKTSIHSKYGKNIWQSKLTENGATTATTTTAAAGLRASIHFSLKSKYKNSPKKTMQFTDLSENQLLQILQSPFDQPLYENISSSMTPPLITSTSSYHHESDENMPPIDFAHNNEGEINLSQKLVMSGSKSSSSPCTPPTNTNQIEAMEHNNTPKENPFMARIRRDLNSPSASTRLRAIKALRSPNAVNHYGNFDIPHEEQDIITEEERNHHAPKTIQEVMKDVVVYVEVRTEADNRSEGIKQVIAKLGATINDKLLRNTTHVVFKDGLLSTYNKAKNWNIPIVSILWIETCRKTMHLADPKRFTISNIDYYENPELHKKIRKQRSMQPNAEERKRVMKPKPIENDFTDIKLPKPRKDRMLEILGSFVKDIVNDEDSDIADRFSPNTKMYEVIQSKNLSLTSSSIDVTNNSNMINDVSNNICDEALSSTRQIENVVNVTPSKKLEEQNIPTSATRRSQRKSMVNKMSYRELSDDDDNDGDDANKTPKNNVPKKINRRRTLLPQFNESSHNSASNSKTTISSNDMSITNSTNSMSLSKFNETPPQKSITKTNNRRKTTHSFGTMDITASQANKTPENNQINKITSYLINTNTPISRPNINQITDNDVIFKTPVAKKKCDAAATPKSKQLVTPKSSARKKTSPLIKSVLRRRTMQVVSAAKTPTNNNIESDKASTPISAYQTPTNNVRRRTLFTPNNMVEISKTMEIDSRRQLNDMDTTNINHETTKAHEVIDNATTQEPNKSILNEYNQSLLFSSTKTPKSNKRKTVFDISMEIIDQRIKNINRNAKLNRSVSESDISIDDLESSVAALPSTRSTPQLDQHVVVEQQPQNKTVTNIEEDQPSASTSSEVVPTTKRKLFAPPSLFNYSEIESSQKTPIKSNKTTTTKTDKKTNNKNICTSETKKRSHDDDEDLIEASQYIAAGSGAPNTAKKFKKDSLLTKNMNKISRRSSFEFQPEKNKIKPSFLSAKKIMPQQTKVAATTTTATSTQQRKLPFMVYTNMHQQQINMVKEAIAKLGGFQLENTVSSKTTHLVSLETRRTINFLRSIARGLWILTYEWITESLKSGQWLLEDLYEIKDFSSAVSMCRAERQAFGSNYRIDIFRDVSPIYVSSECKCADIKELIVLCGGRLTDSKRRARYIIGKFYDKNNTENKDNLDKGICVDMAWILDSISIAKIKKIDKYKL